MPHQCIAHEAQITVHVEREQRTWPIRAHVHIARGLFNTCGNGYEVVGRGPENDPCQYVEIR